jgi:hypothetical protein
MKAKPIHFYAPYQEGEMSFCGLGFFADRSFEGGTNEHKNVTCKNCLKLIKKSTDKPKENHDQ